MRHSPTGGGPNAPLEGWQTRWLKQAIGLLLQTPLAILIGLVGLIICAIIEDIVAFFILGVWGYILKVSITAMFGGLVPITICATLAIAEGHGTAKYEDIKSGLKNYMMIAFLLNTLIVFLAVVLQTMQINFEVNLEATSDVMQRTGVDHFLYGGLMSITNGLIITMPVNILWIALISQMPMSPRKTLMSGILLIKKSFNAWNALILVTLFTTTLTLAIPTHFGIMLLIILSAWLYVAAREIFGGISSNRYSMEVRSSLREA